MTFYFYSCFWVILWRWYPIPEEYIPGVITTLYLINLQRAHDHSKCLLIPYIATCISALLASLYFNSNTIILTTVFSSFLCLFIYLKISAYCVLNKVNRKETREGGRVWEGGRKEDRKKERKQTLLSNVPQSSRRTRKQMSALKCYRCSYSRKYFKIKCILFYMGILF